MNHYAAIEINGTRVLVPARKHNFHKSFMAAERALDRRSRRLTINARGYIWPTNSHIEHATTFAL